MIQQRKQNRAKWFVAASVVFNLSILFVFKYLTFCCTVLDGLSGLSVGVPEIALPIGISFFTFQAMSYVIDVYRGKGSCQKNILNVALYISFFPQLIAGPIVRYETVAYEIEHRKETVNDFLDGFARFVIGLAKKVLIANSVSLFADHAFSSVGQLTVAASWLGIVCYTLQIYFDFSGYSDMAIGLGRMFGFHFLENFNYPYISKSVTEFWRRWHISLGTWFRDYVYIPLGGSRVEKPRLILNLFTVWLLTGIWHGANWTFIVWGLLYFVILTIEKLTGLDKKQPGKAASVIRWGYTILIVMIGWVIFRANNLSDAILYIGTMFGLAGNGLADSAFWAELENLKVFLLCAFVFSTPAVGFFKKRFKLESGMWKILYNIILILLFAFSIANVVSSGHNPFIYFNF